MLLADSVLREDFHNSFHCHLIRNVTHKFILIHEALKYPPLLFMDEEDERLLCPTLEIARRQTGWTQSSTPNVDRKLLPDFYLPFVPYA